MAADGSIIIKTEVDNKKAQSELKKLEGQIDKLNQKISSKNQSMSPLIEQSKELGAALDEASRKLYNMQNNTDFYYTTAQVKEQEKTVKNMTAEYNKLNDRIDKMGSSVKTDTARLEEMQAKAGELAGQLAGAGKNTKGMSEAAEAAQQRMGKLGKHIATLARRVFVFSLITSALRKIKDYMWEAIQTNNEAMAAVARLKAALMTLAQPIINVVIPAFTLMANVITRIINAISRLVSLLFGTTIQKSAQGAKALNDQKKGIEGVGKAAKEANKYLASFDELNVMDDQSGSSASGGGNGFDASGGIAPDFTGQISDSLSAIVELFTGAALLGLGAILTFSGANIPLGIALMALGAIAIWDAVSENWDKIKEMLQGTTLGMAALITGLVLVVLGILLAFSGVSIPVGLGLILAGAAVLAPAVAANWETLKPQILQVCKELLGIGTILLLAIGLVLTFTGNLPLGIGLLIAGAVGLAANAAINWDSIVSALRGQVGKIAAIAGASLLVLGIILLFTGVGIPLGLGLMLAGGASLAAAIAPNWDFIKNKISEVWQNIKNWWKGNVAKFFTKGWWSNLGRGVINGLLSGLTAAWQTVVSWVQSAVNWIVTQFNNAKNALSGNWARSNNLGSGGIGGYRVKVQAMPELRAVDVPALARGAVIPPNRSFMAVLGDQKHGTNIEAPLSTIQQAVAQAFTEMAPEFALAIVQAFAASGTIGNIRAIEEYTKATAQKDFSLGKPNSTTGRWVSQALEAYDAVRG